MGDPMHRKPYEPPKLTLFGDLKRMSRQDPQGGKGPSPAGVSVPTDLF